MLTDTEREKKNSKFVFAKHVVKRDMNFVVRMFNGETRNNMSNERRVKRVCNRRERGKETSKATFDRFDINGREVIF